jgi:capsular polysaccharide transport system permease protein
MPDNRTEIRETFTQRLAPPIEHADLTTRPGNMLRRLIDRALPIEAEGGRRRFALTLPAPPSYGATFVIFVVIPAIIAAIYLWGFASDQFVAEARFAVRALQIDTPRDSSSKNQSILSSSSSGLPVLAGQDAYIVAAYVHSAAIFADLPPNLDPRKIYSRPEADFWARLSPTASIEETTAYWRGMVSTYVDGPSGTVSVYVRAFRRSDARDLLAAILEASEKLVNRISQRARTDAIASSEAEVRRTEGMVRGVLAEMKTYRDSVGFIDPGSAANSTSLLLMQAMSERIRQQSEYFVASRAMSPTAPTVVNQKMRLDALDDQIEQLKAKLTGKTGESNTVSSSLVRYEELELKRIFAEKLYTMAQDSLERAKLRAERQSLYLTVFVEPMLPEEAKYPQRLAVSLLIPTSLLVIWGIFALLVATIEDHTF